MAKLMNLAKVIRRKNAGPYEITFDIMFPDKASYELVKNSDALSKENICKLYHIDEDQIVSMLYFEPALAYKFTVIRPANHLQGSIGENDTFGTQQHVPLMNIEVEV